MVVAIGQFTQLPVKPAAAGVVVPWWAPTITALVAERLDNLFHCARLHKYAATFTHGDVVRGIKACGRDVAKRANGFAVVCGANCVAGVFDNEKVVFLGNAHYAIKVERVAESVGHHDCFCLGTDGGFDAFDSGIESSQLHIDEHWC